MSHDLREKFLTSLRTAVQDGSLLKLTLGKPRGADDLHNLFVRPLVLRGAPHYSFVWRHATRDITKNHPPAEALTQLEPLIGAQFHSAHLFTTERTAQLEYNKNGEPRLTFGKAVAVDVQTEHDRAKSRLLTRDSQPWLHALGVTTATGAVREGLADKHRQIHKFVEILSHLTGDLNWAAGGPIEIADMGCGKGYLTFATHDYFNLVARQPANVRGVEARPELVDFCNRVARDAHRTHLHFEAGTISDAKLEAIDVLIALHACDTATDDALARGIAAGATLLVVAPCCQKELRPQLTAAPVLAPALSHGIFRERHAEFATDALRALLLEWAGYDTKVFEFISTDHTAKNLMIAATKRAGANRTEGAANAVRDLAAFYGVKSQALARHLGFDLNHG
ncbi:MAG TPA: SAM-dependent methyltransferase [Candidatus Didemnitutus sp.]|nr:SAM-dependent methyltransferase [Candidatus Didemnitutus sp.]